MDAAGDPCRHTPIPLRPIPAAPPPPPPPDAAALGWDPFFAEQVTEEEESAGRVPARVCRVQARRCQVWVPADASTSEAVTTQTLAVALFGEAGLPTVGDWVLLDPERRERPRKLDARTTLTRQAPGGRGVDQALAANVDTLLIVTACNQEFSVARIERYLASRVRRRVRPACGPSSS